MRIALNCLHIMPGRLGGLETYMVNLLDDLADVRHGHDILLLCANKYKDHFDRWAHIFNIVPFNVDVDSAPIRIMFEQLLMPRYLREYGVDVLHSSGYTAPITHLCHTVMTVHDLNYIEIPDTVRQSHGAMRWFAVRLLGYLAMKKADHIVAVTEHMASQIHKLCGIPLKRISVIYNRSPMDFANVPKQAIRLPTDIIGDYILYVASWFPHKNHRVLFDAIALSKLRHGKHYKVVLAGLHLRSERMRSELTRELDIRGIRDQVIVIEEYLSVESLAYLYGNAKVSVFASRYEGFGIPVVEAMSAGTPVVCANLAPMTEIGQDAIVTFNPDSPEELLKQVDLLYSNDTLREEYSRKGRRRYLQLSETDRTAGERILQIYMAVADAL